MINIKQKIVGISILILISISFIYNIYKYEIKYNLDSKNQKYNVMIIEKQKEDDNKIVYLARLNNDKFILNLYIKNKYDSDKDFTSEKIQEVKEYKYGDYIKINGKITIPEKLGNIGEFDYKSYLNSKDICGVINAYEVEYVDNIGGTFLKQIYTLKDCIAKNMDDKLETKEAELLKGMIYGDTRNLDEEIKENFNKIGISHITAVSGSNLNVLLLIITYALYKLKNKQKLIILIQVFVIVLFCIISSFELSIVRASIMSVITIICKYRNIKIPTEKVLIITLLIMVIVNPFRIFNIGLEFSFLAIIGLIFFYSKIYNFLESKIKWNIKNKIVIKMLCFIANVLSITLSVNILVLPLSIYYFNTFSLMFIFANLIIYCLATIINLLGIISILLIKIPGISNILFFILNILLKLVIYISEFLSDINICINVKSFTGIILIIYYTYILIICMKLRSSRKYIIYKLETVKKKVAIFLVVTISIICTYNTFFNNYIYFFNVGQGEMSVIKNKDTVILVDSGSITNDATYIFEAYMKKENIQKIDALVISHFHSDHVNGIKEIIKLCQVKYLIYSYPYNVQNEEYVNLMKELENEDIKHIIVKAGDNIELNDIELNILYPTDEYLTISNKIDENENANSLAFNVNINNKNYLFMGDSIKQSEKYVIDNLKKQNIESIELIKVGHHGSKTSTSENLLNYIFPKYAIISSKKKVYNHPSKETINVLNKYNVKTYITEKVGGIKYII